MSISSKSKNLESSGKSHAGIKRSKKEEQEFGPGKKDVVLCKDCSAAYYYKSWHHNLRNYGQISEDKDVKFVICPACQMIKDKKFEGQVIFQNVPDEFIKDVLLNIKNTGQRTYKRDPMDRIIDIKDKRSKDVWNVEVLTTENQLARNIARQVEQAFKGLNGEDIKWSKEESTARIVIRF